MTEFAEERLDLGINYGAVGGPGFKTTITESKDGREQRNALWWLPLGRWQLGEKTLLESDIETIHEVQYLIDFHKYRQGSKIGFRYKDWTDYQAWDVELGTADGITTQWQLKKIYWAGNQKTYRPITKPAPDKVKIYFDGDLLLSGYYVDYALGIVVFDTPPEPGILITTDFEFDVPVCFEKDDISFELSGYDEGEAIYRLESVFVKEIRVSLSLPWYDLNTITKLPPLNLSILLDTSEKLSFNTTIETLASGYDVRFNNWNNAKNDITINNKVWDDTEKDLIYGYFWNTKGRNQQFYLLLNNNEYLCRFKEDSLNFKFEASEDDCNLFSSSLAFVNLTNLKYELFLTDVPTIYEAGSIVNLAGIARSETGQTVANLLLQIQFDFADDTVFNVVTDENGIFTATLQVKPTLLHPDTGKLIIRNAQTSFIYKQYDIATSPDAVPVFSLNVSDTIFSGENITVSGTAPAGTTFNLSCPELSFNQNLVADAVGEYGVFSFPIDESTNSFTANFTATHPDFDPIIASCVVTKLVFNPVLGLDNFRYN